jgi:hypothetical protein
MTLGHGQQLLLHFLSFISRAWLFSGDIKNFSLMVPACYALIGFQFLLVESHNLKKK